MVSLGQAAFLGRPPVCFLKTAVENGAPNSDSARRRFVSRNAPIRRSALRSRRRECVVKTIAVVDRPEIERIRRLAILQEAHAAVGEGEVGSRAAQSRTRTRVPSVLD